MKTYVISSAEELEAVLTELTETPKPKKEPDIVFCDQDERDLLAVAMEAYAEKFALVNRRFSEIFAALAKQERTGH